MTKRKLPDTKATQTRLPRQDRDTTCGDACPAPTARSRPLDAKGKAPREPAAPRQTKVALLRKRLATPGGVAMQSLMADTSWQAHTLRAALSGLRKTGLVIVHRRENGETIYSLDASADAARAVKIAEGIPDSAIEVSYGQLPAGVPTDAIDGAGVSGGCDTAASTSARDTRSSASGNDVTASSPGVDTSPLAQHSAGAGAGAGAGE